MTRLSDVGQTAGIDAGLGGFRSGTKGGTGHRSEVDG